MFFPTENTQIPIRLVLPNPVELASAIISVKLNPIKNKPVVTTIDSPIPLNTEPITILVWEIELE